MNGIIYMLIVLLIMYAIYVYRKTNVLKCEYTNEVNVVEADEIESEAVIKNSITILNSKLDSIQKATAIIALLECAYILIHIQPNQGQNYDDKKQSAKFKKSLNSKTIKKIFDLEGRYE